LVTERLSGELRQAVTALCWSPDGEFLAMASAGGETLLLDFRAGCEELLRGDRDSSIDAIGFSADGQFLMAVGQAGELLLWELGGPGTRPLALDPMPVSRG
jgi:WD40 repeat protein